MEQANKHPNRVLPAVPTLIKRAIMRQDGGQLRQPGQFPKDIHCEADLALCAWLTLLMLTIDKCAR